MHGLGVSMVVATKKRRKQTDMFWCIRRKQHLGHPHLKTPFGNHSGLEFSSHPLRLTMISIYLDECKALILQRNPLFVYPSWSSKDHELFFNMSPFRRMQCISTKSHRSHNSKSRNASLANPFRVWQNLVTQLRGHFWDHLKRRLPTSS